MGAPFDIQRRMLTVEDYRRMGEVGIFGKHDRVELVEGELIQMAPIGPSHARAVIFLTKEFVLQLGDRAYASVQASFSLPPLNEFEPDLAIVTAEWADGTRLPGREHALLVVEVSHSSLRYDRDVKLPIYARHGIPEVWLFDVEREQVLVHRDPEPTGYRTRSVAAKHEVLTPALLPHVHIDLKTIYR